MRLVSLLAEEPEKLLVSQACLAKHALDDVLWQVKAFVGTGVTCETWALQAAVIPAKAGIYSANLRKCAVDGLDSRFCGNDRCFERDPIPRLWGCLR
jgi:hypothetical protein